MVSRHDGPLDGYRRRAPVRDPRYIAQDSPLYARGVVDRLTERSKQLAHFPMSGRMVAGFEAKDVRQLFEGTYRIIYRVRPDWVEVLAVLHAAREFPGRFTQFDMDP